MGRMFFIGKVGFLKFLYVDHDAATPAAVDQLIDVSTIISLLCNCFSLVSWANAAIRLDHCSE